MRNPVWLPLGAALAMSVTPAGAQHRELGAHEHGRGTLNIAVEGSRVAMELEAPGADIVGFEHEARTRRQKEAVEKAKAQLRAPQALFKFPAAAGCMVQDANVAIENEGDDHDKDKGIAAGKKSTDGDKSKDHDAHGHSQFHVQYTFDCKVPANIMAIEFGYFRTFAGAQKLEVNLITAKGQTKFEVTRAKPRLDLAGQM